MRLYDLITIYEDVIKKHERFDIINRYDLQLIVDVDDKTFHDDLVIVADDYRKVVFFLSGLHQPLEDWMDDNIRHGEILYVNEEAHDDLEW